MTSHGIADHPKICIVGLKCYDLLSGAKRPRYIGGIENQLARLACGLAHREFPVSFVTYDQGQPDATRHEGIWVYKAFGQTAGIFGVRFLHPRWTGLCSALHRADADIYYQMGAGCETGQVALWCRKRRKHFIFSTASDADCDPSLPLLRTYREKCLYRYGLKHATLVISQTRTQRQLLLDHFGVASKIFGILSPQPRMEASAPGERRRILWVGRICPEKRPHLLVDVARGLPGCTIDVIGDANADTAYARSFRQQAQHHSSLILHGKVSNDLLEEMYREALLLVGTSQTEGFPVIFVEAWSRGIPVVSTFDPDGVIQANGLGRVAHGVEDIVAYVTQITQSPDVWLKDSAAARQYYLANHAPEVCLPRFASLLSDVEASSSAEDGTLRPADSPAEIDHV